MQLSGSERGKLEDAISDAYNNIELLKIRIGRDEKLSPSLQQVNWQQAPAIIINNLVGWAIAQYRIQYLILAAISGNQDNPKLQEFYQKFCYKIADNHFILNPTGGNSAIDISIDISSDIEWLETPDNIQYESLLKDEPNWYDVNFLQQAMESSLSVCKVEIPKHKITATGVLIDKRLVLTNYHVLHPPQQPNITINPQEIILRFGYFDDIANKGKAFRLDQGNPILSSSPTSILDYVLLQVDESILQTKDIKPVNWNSHNILVQGSSINLLQHPGGETLKVCLSPDAITAVNERKGLVQYVSRTCSGSSGSPCFDNDWNLVALHHAEIDRLFGSVRGSIRQGILFNSIYQDISNNDINLQS
ncbi:MAG: trypsin-like peptidase domain-containing protein [Sphaerospermopsis sp.]|nr:trypsin-like peptidase domain-containing protein [Sphaerospermopsis sp.]